MRGKLTPNSRATKVSIVRIKKRPRGKSFEPGNGHGAATRLKPGQSGNPSGRPLCKEVNLAARDFLGAHKRNTPRALTNAEVIVAAQGHKAKNGDLGAATFLADRAEGRPAVKVNVDSGPDNLTLIVQRMNQRSEDELGPPEGMIKPQLTEGNEHEDNEETA